MSETTQPARKASSTIRSAARLPLVVLVGLGIAYWVIGGSPAFQHCVHEHKNDESYHALHEDTPIASRVARLHLQTVCVENWTDIYQGAIGAVATIVVAVFTATLWFVTRRSVKATEIAAEAAKAGVDLARSSFIVENRAYVMPAEFQIFRVGDPNTGIFEWRFIPQWRNTGQTPARKVRHLTCGAFFLKEGMPADFDFPDHERVGPDQISGRMIGPSFTVGGPHFQLNPFIVRDIQKQGRIFIWCWVEYRDVFSGTPFRRTEWCSELVIIGNPTDTRSDVQAIFQLMPTDRFNGNDEDCYRQAGEAARLVTIEELLPKSMREPVLLMTHSFTMPYPGWPLPQ